jgi:hypothetical protein
MRYQQNKTDLPHSRPPPIATRELWVRKAFQRQVAVVMLLRSPLAAELPHREFSDALCARDWALSCACRKCQTATATPVEPGDLLWDVRHSRPFPVAGGSAERSLSHRRLQTQPRPVMKVQWRSLWFGSSITQADLAVALSRTRFTVSN